MKIKVYPNGRSFAVLNILHILPEIAIFVSPFVRFGVAWHIGPRIALTFRQWSVPKCGTHEITPPTNTFIDLSLCSRLLLGWGRLYKRLSLRAWTCGVHCYRCLDRKFQFVGTYFEKNGAYKLFHFRTFYQKQCKFIVVILGVLCMYACTYAAV